MRHKLVLGHTVYFVASAYAPQAVEMIRKKNTFITR